MRRWLVALLVVGPLIGLPALILQRWVAETRFAAIVLVLVWFAVVGVGLAVYTWRRADLRRPLLGAFAAILAGTVAIGWATGFRDMVVDEDVAMASMRADGPQRERSLSGDASARPDRPAGPVELASGDFTGEDGHAGAGVATVVEQPDGERVLTFTRFDVDPGVDVDVYLAPEPGGIDGGVKLGDLKGNVGDQQYAIPAGTDLREHANVVLWCVPFTVRIAVARLDA
jgi:hypothetical protein